MIEQRLVTTILFFSLRRGIQTNFDEKKERKKKKTNMVLNIIDYLIDFDVSKNVLLN